MAELSLDLRRRIVSAYQSGKSGTYDQTAKSFDVGRATVSRLLRRHRETNDVKSKRRGGNNPRRVDLDWLRSHAETNPDARLVDRIEAWESHSGCAVSMGAMWGAMKLIGWSHKKKRLSREKDNPDVIAKRDTFAAAQSKLPASRLVFLDESGFRLGRVCWLRSGYEMKPVLVRSAAFDSRPRARSGRTVR